MFYPETNSQILLDALDALRNNTAVNVCLQQLNINDNNIPSLINTLRVNTSMQSLDLSDNPINANALKQIINALSSHPGLRKLTLKGLHQNGYQRKGPEYIHALMPVCKKPQFKELILSCNNFNTEAMLLLARIIKQNKNLALLDISDGRKLDKSEEDAFVSAMEKNKIIILEVNCNATSAIRKLNKRNRVIKQGHDEINFFYYMADECLALNLTEADIKRIVDEYYKELEKQDLVDVMPHSGRHPGYHECLRMLLNQNSSQLDDTLLPAIAEGFNQLADNKIKEMKQQRNFFIGLLNESSLTNLNSRHIVIEENYFIKIKEMIKATIKKISVFFENTMSKFFRSSNAASGDAQINNRIQQLAITLENKSVPNKQEVIHWGNFFPIASGSSATAEQTTDTNKKLVK